MKVIRFWRIPPKETCLFEGREYPIGEIAFNEHDLAEKLNGDTAKIDMPAKPWYVRLWRIFFPLKGVEMSVEMSNECITLE